jgi:hypothetical protein
MDCKGTDEGVNASPVPSSAEVVNALSYTANPSYTCVAWRLGKYQRQHYLYLMRALLFLNCVQLKKRLNFLALASHLLYRKCSIFLLVTRMNSTVILTGGFSQTWLKIRQRKSTHLSYTIEVEIRTIWSKELRVIRSRPTLQFLKLDLLAFISVWINLKACHTTWTSNAFSTLVKGLSSITHYALKHSNSLRLMKAYNYLQYTAS